MRGVLYPLPLVNYSLELVRLLGGTYHDQKVEIFSELALLVLSSCLQTKSWISYLGGGMHKPKMHKEGPNIQKLQNRNRSDQQASNFYNFRLLSGRTYYTNCDGNLPAFLNLIKQKGRFDAIIRWSLPYRDLAPRKFVQLTRKIC